MDISEADSPPPLSPCSTTTESLCRQVRENSTNLHEILALVPRDRPDPHTRRSPKAKADAKPSKKSKKSPKSPKTPKSKCKKGGKKKQKKSKGSKTTTTKEERKKKAKSEGDEGNRKAPAPGSRLSHPYYHEGETVTLPLHLIWRLLTEEQQEILVQMKYLSERRVA
uniref:HMGA1 n=1 Tax=Panagrellus redivivus TaxID=6233 RepID=A0A7E4VFZ7_PANRE